MNSDDMKKLCSDAIGITAPWRVKDVVFDDDKFHILVGFDEKAFPGLEEREEMTWRHYNLFQYPCYITVEVPVVRGSDGKRRVVEPEWKKTPERYATLK